MGGLEIGVAAQGVHVHFGIAAHLQVTAWIGHGGLWTGDLRLCE